MKPLIDFSIISALPIRPEFIFPLSMMMIYSFLFIFLFIYKIRYRVSFIREGATAIWMDLKEEWLVWGTTPSVETHSTASKYIDDNCQLVSGF